LVSETGSKTQPGTGQRRGAAGVAEQAQASRDSLSAVNLDEEAANLIRYQQAYQASAKALQIAASLFDTILQLAGRPEEAGTPCGIRHQSKSDSDRGRRTGCASVPASFTLACANGFERNQAASSSSCRSRFRVTAGC
jgi:hypothetical protein